jgi:hypothetical protein
VHWDWHGHSLRPDSCGFASFLAEAPVKTRTTVVNAILNQIPISQQDAFVLA